MKHIIKFILPAAALAAVVACSRTALEPTDPNAGKELISFAGDGSAFTKASLTKAGFESETKVVMRIKAEAEGKTTRYTEAVATASANITSDTHSSLVHDHSDLSYAAGYERYWDDAFGRDSKLTVYAFAIPGKTDANDTEDKTVAWDVLTVQSAETMAVKDLAYSNNISESGKGGRYSFTYNTTDSKWDLEDEMGNGCMAWTQKPGSVTTGKFDQGHLVFQHALAWIEINLKEGNGFDNLHATDFGWTNPTAQSITLKTFNTKGTFDVSTAAWSGQTPADITTLNEKTATVTETGKTTRHLHAYVVPGNNLYTENSNVIEFEIDNAKYYVSGKQIAEAIRSYDYGTEGKKYADFETIEAGKHYAINLTVAKKGVERITAALIEWEDVNGEADAKNTHATFAFEDRGSRLEDAAGGKQFNIYRAEQTATDYITGTEDKNYDWQTGYTAEGAASKNWDDTNKEWEATSWYWKDNKTYYHFRAAGYTGGSDAVPTLEVKTANGVDYFEMNHGALEGTTDYKDYIWGAPLADVDATAKLSYSTTTGFDNENGTNHQIVPAIGATDAQINMVMFHMTSQITVNVRTTTGASRVILQDGSDNTKVEILNFLPDGTVQMGDGLVSATGTRTNAAMTTGTYIAGDETADPAIAAKFDGFKYGVVPQALSWTDPTAGTIGLRITTPDGNQYLVPDLSKVIGSVSSNNLAIPYTEASTGKYNIDAWYPNYKYVYTVSIQKKGIDRITSSVLPWDTVESDNINIDLEN